MYLLSCYLYYAIPAEPGKSVQEIAKGLLGSLISVKVMNSFI